ncbi:MAG: GNAT family N-acetyltransferase [Acidobacteriota bacterium]
MHPRDAPVLARLAATQPIWPVTATVPRTEGESARLIAWLQAERAAGRGLAYGVAVGGGDPIIGMIRLRRIDAAFRIADASFVFDDPTWDGLLPAGVLREAFDFAFRYLGLHRLEVRTMTVREAELLGDLEATLEGRLRESWPAGDALVDQHLWSILGPEWMDRAHAPVRLGLGVVSRPEAPPEPAKHDTDDPPPPWTQTPPSASRAGVTVREVRSGDARALLKTFTPDEIRACINPPTTTVEAFNRYIAWAKQERTRGRAVSFAILTNHSPDPVGLVQVRCLERQAAVADMGVLLARSCRGTGVFPAAMRLVLDFTFDTMGLHRLEARTSATNQAGMGALRKLGAMREARLRGSFPRGAEFVDDDLWSILGSDWRAAREIG